MVSAISKTNSFSKSLYDCLSKEKQPMTKRNLESLTPPGTKGITDLFQANDFFDNPTEKQKTVFNKLWINDLVKKPEHILKCYKILYAHGFTLQEARTVVEYSKENAYRAKESAHDNERFGLTGSQATSANIFIGIVKELLDSESTPWFVKKIVDLAYGITKGIRSFTQYSIYGRHDDDAAMNQYQASVYGNKVAGKLSEASVFTETKINSWAYAVLEVLPHSVSDPAKKLLSLPTSLWWRSRMGAHINQQFFTDFLSYLWNKPLSLFGNKKSKEEIKAIKERDNISFSYFMERHYKNAGLTKKKDQIFSKFLKQSFKNIKNTFSSDIVTQKSSSKKLAETISPVLGMYGVFSVAIGNISSTILKVFHINSKLLDTLSASAFVSQQMIYLPKIIMPMYNETKELDEALRATESTERFQKAEIDNLREFNKEKRNLSYFGFTALPLSILNTAFRMFNFEDGFMQRVKAIAEDVSGGVSNRFFSHRRHLIGKQFRLENPEFY